MFATSFKTYKEYTEHRRMTGHQVLPESLWNELKQAQEAEK